MTQITLDVLPRVRRGGYFAKYARECGERVAKDSMPNVYPAELAEEPDAFLQSLFDSGNAFEDDVFDVIEESSTGVVRIVETLVNGERTDAGRAAVEEETFDAVMNPDVRIILGGRIGSVFETLLARSRGEDGVYDPDRVSQPDIIVVDRSEGVKLRAVDVKDHKVLTGSAAPKEWVTLDIGDLCAPGSAQLAAGSPHAVDVMQLAHYQTHFEALGLAADRVGAIVGRGPTVVQFDLTHPYFPHPLGRGYGKVSSMELYEYWFTQASNIAENAALRDAGAAVEPTTFPEASAACDHCPWRTVCGEELAAHGDGGHITLLPGITPARAKAHYAAGVSSIRELARVDVKAAAIIDAGGVPECDEYSKRYVNVKAHNLEQAVYQARVSTYGRVARKVDVTHVELHRADVEIDFDLENSNGPVIVRDDGSHSGGPLVYLWGTREVRHVNTGGVSKVSVKVRQFSDFTDTDNGERDAFIAFWNFLTTSRAKAVKSGKTWRAYHYTNHEVSWMRKLAEKYSQHPGVPSSADVEALLATGDVVDMYAVLTEQLMWPTSSHSIKDLAKWARFSWKATDAGGDSSILWYGNAVSNPDPKVRAANAKRVLQYNVDDVAAQHHLREWVASLEASEDPGKKIPSVTALRKPLAKR